MKKIVTLVLIIVLIAIFKNISYENNLIPKEAIRLRVLANSNSTYDQSIKKDVSEVLQGNIYTLLKDTTNINEARSIIKNNINNFDKEVGETLASKNYSLGYTIDFGSHYFPSKEYKGVKYKEGYYESLLVKLGEGKGNNWWCVLFPPLCLLEAEDSTEVEYKFFVQELIDKFF